MEVSLLGTVLSCYGAGRKSSLPTTTRLLFRSRYRKDLRNVYDRQEAQPANPREFWLAPVNDEGPNEKRCHEYQQKMKFCLGRASQRVRRIKRTDETNPPKPPSAPSEHNKNSNSQNFPFQFWIMKSEHQKRGSLSWFTSFPSPFREFIVMDGALRAEHAIEEMKRAGIAVMQSADLVNTK